MMLTLLACTTSSAVPQPGADLPFKLVKIASVTAPTAILGKPDGNLLILQQQGTIVEVTGSLTIPILDIQKRIKSGGETGLLGAALARDFPADPRIFLNYTTLVDKKLETRIVSMQFDSKGDIDPTTEVQLLVIPQPYSNHNSGSLAVAPDKTLFIGVGDGGSANDPLGTGQDKSDLLGSILRIDPTFEGEKPYRIPSDNPFVTEANSRPEIWAYGVRNPWGMHMDGDILYFADVGQNLWEEVNRGHKGGNYGWDILEGTHCFEGDHCESLRPQTIAPLAEYGHDLGQSVTGGVVYRGPSIPRLDNRYLYADFVTGVLWALPEGGVPERIGPTGLMPSCFGTDRQNRLYIGDYKGSLYRVDPG